jgi:glycosyltransferase involved in cell wall biosynthesis
LFPGWIDQSDLPAIYSLADLYLYPSNLEAFPIPITEAMACGTPIITSRANGLEEIAGSAALLVNPDDPEEIADAVQRVLTTPGLQAELSAAGLERSRRFSWERCAKETLDILRGLAAAAPLTAL